MAEQIRVRIMTLAAGPAGVYQPGTEVLLPAAEAEAMIDGGHAHRLGTASATSASEATPAPPPGGEHGPESWTATAEEDDEHEEARETAVDRPMPAPRAAETATSAPQRASEADDVLAAEAAGRQAATKKEPRSSNPHDRRTTLGRAWDRGWESVG